MNWRQHALFALLFYAISLATLYASGAPLALTTIIFGAVIAVFYGLLPDIDTEKSKIHSLLVPAVLLAAISMATLYLALGQLVFLVMFVVLAASALVTKFMRHRGFTHTVRFGLMSSLPILFVNPVYFAFALAGFISHLFGDLQFSF